MIGNCIYLSNIIGEGNSWFGVYNSAGIELFTVSQIYTEKYTIVPLLQELKPYPVRQLTIPRQDIITPILLRATHGIYYWYSQYYNGFRLSIGNEVMVSTNCEHKDSKIWLEIVTLHNKIYFKTQLEISNKPKFFTIMGMWRGQ